MEPMPEFNEVETPLPQNIQKWMDGDWTGFTWKGEDGEHYQVIGWDFRGCWLYNRTLNQWPIPLQIDTFSLFKILVAQLHAQVARLEYFLEDGRQYIQRAHSALDQGQIARKNEQGESIDLPERITRALAWRGK